MVSIVVVGSVNLDIVAAADHLPMPGETVTDAVLGRYPGGKGANQALAARRLGAGVQLVAHVGNDSAADEALAMLRDGGVDLSNCLVVDDTPTGVALICVAKSGENQIVVAPGANRTLTPGSMQVPKADALICQLEVPIAAVAHAAGGFDGFFCTNLAPARHVDVSVLQRADLVVVNETEASWYGGSLSACNGMIAATHGADGAELIRNGEIIARSAPPEVSAVDTTGAGDTFTAALTVALVEGQSPDDALRFACAAGAAATLKMGAQPSLPTREEVVELMGTLAS